MNLDHTNCLQVQKEMFVALLETGLNTSVELFDDRDGVGALRQLDEGRSAGEVGVSIMVSEVRRFTYANNRTIMRATRRTCTPRPSGDFPLRIGVKFYLR